MCGCGCVCMCVCVCVCVHVGVCMWVCLTACSECKWVYIHKPLPLLPVSYCEQVPSGGPPSFSGRLVKYTYKLAVGAQRPGCPAQISRMPFHVRTIPGGDMYCTVIAANGTSQHGCQISFIAQSLVIICISTPSPPPHSLSSPASHSHSLPSLARGHLSQVYSCFSQDHALPLARGQGRLTPRPCPAGSRHGNLQTNLQ